MRPRQSLIDQPDLIILVQWQHQTRNSIIEMIISVLLTKLIASALTPIGPLISTGCTADCAGQGRHTIAIERWHNNEWRL
jgi:hypothetical protein